MTGTEMTFPDGHRGAVSLETLFEVQKRNTDFQKGGRERGRGTVSAPTGGHALSFADILLRTGKTDGANDL